MSSLRHRITVMAAANQSKRHTAQRGHAVRGLAAVMARGVVGCSRRVMAAARIRGAGRRSRDHVTGSRSPSSRRWQDRGSTWTLIGHHLAPVAPARSQSEHEPSSRCTSHHRRRWVSERQEERASSCFATASTVMAAADNSKRRTAQRDHAASRACGARARRRGPGLLAWAAGRWRPPTSAVAGSPGRDHFTW